MAMLREMVAAEGSGMSGPYNALVVGSWFGGFRGWFLVLMGHPERFKPGTLTQNLPFQAPSFYVKRRPFNNTIHMEKGRQVSYLGPFLTEIDAVVPQSIIMLRLGTLHGRRGLW